MAKQIVCDVVFNADGSVNSEATQENFSGLLNDLKARVQTDFDSVSVEITTFLLANPALKTIPTSELVRSLWETRVENGELKGKSQQEKSALFSRLEEVVPEYVKSNTDMFHMGRKTGIAIHYVTGETAKDAKGQETFDGEGNPVQAYRTDAETWAKITAPKPAKDAPATANAA
jgi:hypothetical protein